MVPKRPLASCNHGVGSYWGKDMGQRGRQRLLASAMGVIRGKNMGAEVDTTSCGFGNGSYWGKDVGHRGQYGVLTQWVTVIDTASCIKGFGNYWETV